MLNEEDDKFEITQKEVKQYKQQTNSFRIHEMICKRVVVDVVWFPTFRQVLGFTNECYKTNNQESPLPAYNCCMCKAKNYTLLAQKCKNCQEQQQVSD